MSDPKSFLCYMCGAMLSMYVSCDMFSLYRMWFGSQLHA